MIHLIAGESRAELQGNSSERRSADACVTLVTLFFLCVVSAVASSSTSMSLKSPSAMRRENVKNVRRRCDDRSEIKMVRELVLRTVTQSSWSHVRVTLFKVLIVNLICGI